MDDSHDQFSPHLRMCLVESFMLHLPNFYRIFTKFFYQVFTKFLPNFYQVFTRFFYEGFFKHSIFFARGSVSTWIFSIWLLLQFDDFHEGFCKHNIFCTDAGKFHRYTSWIHIVKCLRWRNGDLWWLGLKTLLGSI